MLSAFGLDDLNFLDDRRPSRDNAHSPVLTSSGRSWVLVGTANRPIAILSPTLSAEAIEKSGAHPPEQASQGPHGCGFAVAHAQSLAEEAR